MEIQKSPRWRQLYPPKVSTATGSEKITWAMWAVGGAAKPLGPSSLLIRVLSVDSQFCMLKNFVSNCAICPQNQKIRKVTARTWVVDLVGSSRLKSSLSSVLVKYRIGFFSSSTVWRVNDDLKTCRLVLRKIKAGYTATEVACGWAGAIFEVSGAFGQERYSQKPHKRRKSKVWRTDGRTDRRTDRQSGV